jgi:hypothetical protein
LLDTDMRLEEHARSITGRRARFLKSIEKYAPRVLGLAAFVAMFFACIRALRNLPDLSRLNVDAGPIQQNLYLIMGALFLLAVLFLLYTVKRQDIAKTKFVGLIDKAANWLLRLLRIEGLAHWLPSRRNARGRNVGPLFLILIAILFCVIPIFFPANAARYIPLALFIPFVIGGWLPILSLLSGLGRRMRVPIITIVLAILWIGPAYFGEGYGVRRIENTADQIERISKKKSASTLENSLRSMQLQEALTLWMGANDCEGAAWKCPRPIIVVASGGASRAGFFTASIVGALLDSQNYKVKADSKPHGLTPKDIQKRIFAFSTVSGSSVGAVMTVSAMAAAGKEMAQPCGKKVLAKYWHAFPDKDREIANWRDCLEALMTGDYLTPAFSGFMFRDVFRIFSFLPDRATLLEESWEQHFSAVIKDPKNEGSLACIGSLECPFRSLRPTNTRWLPLLVLNGTSVTTGQRIVTSILEWPAKKDDDPSKQNPKRAEGICGLQPREYRCALFDNTFLYHWLAGIRHPAKDIAISTAALNSARFPLISPPGEIFAEVKDEDGKDVRTMRDRVVDGGYFENYGALTALELVTAIQALHPALAPFILSLTNDPEIPLPFAFDPSNAPGTENSLAIDITGPVDAIMNARSATGYITLIGIEKVMRPNMNKECSINSSYIRVWPPLRVKDKNGSPDRPAAADRNIEVETQRPLSMSWWLSRPVQRYLHHQISLDANGCGDNLFCNENQEGINAFMNQALLKPQNCAGAPSGTSIAIDIETILKTTDSLSKFITRRSEGEKRN